MYTVAFTGQYKISYISGLVKQLETALPGARNHTHLKHHQSDNQRVGVLGASIFTHLGVDGPDTRRSIGVQNFQV